MHITVEQILYFDPQAAPHKAFCPQCGGHLYGSDTPCLRCARREP